MNQIQFEYRLYRDAWERREFDDTWPVMADALFKQAQAEVCESYRCSLRMVYKFAFIVNEKT